MPLVEHPPDRIRRVEFVPFKAAIAANVACLMTAHVLVPALDEENPGTLSRRIVSGLLREELGFDGVIFSDDMEMKAIAKRFSMGDAAVQAIAAGCDGVLICSGNIEAQIEVLEALVHAVEDGRLPVKRVEDALARHRRAKERFLAAPASARREPLRAVIGADEHRRIADEMSRFL
jgi:beta-N-acetylhexosaminidase